MTIHKACAPNTMVQEVKTTCAYCGVGCGLIAQQDGSGHVTIKGDPDHPANFGRLCSKGTALGETVGLEGRLLAPRYQGRDISWDEALTKMATRFSDIIAQHGPDSVAFYVSGQILTEDYYVANKLMKGFIGSANIDTNSRLCMASSVAGHRRAFGSDTVPGCYDDLEKANLVILVGSNLAWCHPVIFQRLEQAKQDNPNLKIIVIDPRRTMTCAIADVHLAINPDGDTALFTYLLDFLVRNGYVDQDYIGRYTNGFDAAIEAAHQLSMERVLERTGLSYESLIEFASLFANTPKCVTIYSQGVNQSSEGTDKVNAILNCHLATGRIGKEGMGPFSMTGQPNAMGGREVGGLANMLAAHMAIENEEHRALVQHFWQAPRMAQKQGLKAVDLFKAVEDGKVKAVWIMATNPVDSVPEADRVRDALKQCEFVVVSDILQETDTMAVADLCLPSTGWGEKSGTVTNSERRISRQRSFLKAPGVAKPDWWQICEFAKKLGYTKAFDYKNEAEIYREHAALSDFKNQGTRDFDIGAHAHLDNAGYDKMQPFQWPLPKDSGDQNNVTRFFANGGFFTPDRRAQFIAYNATATRKQPSNMMSLNTGRIRDHWHTMTRTAKSARLSSHMAEPYCEIHPADADIYGVQDAELVHVSTQHGSTLVRALITDRQKEGHLFIPMHWTDQFAAKGRVNALIPMITDPFSGQPASKNNPCHLENARMSYYGFWAGLSDPDLSSLPYWAKAPIEGGMRIEFAFRDFSEAASLNPFFAEDTKTKPMKYEDQRDGSLRMAWFDGDQLAAFLFLSPRPVYLDRTYLLDQLGKDFKDLSMRHHILTGINAEPGQSKGRIVCACHQIGLNQILTAMESGAQDVTSIGKACHAGTNCGACRSEIQEILHVSLSQAAE